MQMQRVGFARVGVRTGWGSLAMLKALQYGMHSSFCAEVTNKSNHEVIQ